MNLYDILLARCICSNKTEYETLDVTENGTYDAPQGKAYDKVNVNVSGGSSDFSTARVTIGEGVDGQLLGAIVDVSESWGLPQGTLPSVIDPVYISGTINVCLYNGHTLFYAYGDVAVTGNITFLTTADDVPIYDITGDCTITAA